MVFAEICLTVWTIPSGLKFFAFYAGGLSGMASPILVSLTIDTPLTPVLVDQLGPARVDRGARPHHQQHDDVWLQHVHLGASVSTTRR